MILAQWKDLIHLELKNITFACKYRNKYDFELRIRDAQGIYGERFRIPLTKSILRDNYL
jgi:hypothetical protein